MNLYIKDIQAKYQLTPFERLVLSLSYQKLTYDLIQDLNL